MDCPFCNRKDVVSRNEQAYLIYDKNPVTNGHMLVVTISHVTNFFAATTSQRQAMLKLVEESREGQVRAEHRPRSKRHASATAGTTA